jgi:hypothetical protein
VEEPQVSWTIEEIERDWLGPKGDVAVPRNELPAVFERIERAVGRRWLENARGGAGITGPAVVAAILRRDRVLRSLEGVKGGYLLTDRLRRNDASADAEISALYLTRDGETIEIEAALESMNKAGSKPPTSDFGATRHPGRTSR